MKLSEFLEMFGASESAIVNLTGAEAIEAVKRSGLALQHVKEQTPDICLAAVKQDADALQFVNKSIFDQEAPAAQG